MLLHHLDGVFKFLHSEDRFRKVPCLVTENAVLVDNEEYLFSSLVRCASEKKSASRENWMRQACFQRGADLLFLTDFFSVARRTEVGKRYFS